MSIHYYDSDQNHHCVVYDPIKDKLPYHCYLLTTKYGMVIRCTKRLLPIVPTSDRVVSIQDDSVNNEPHGPSLLPRSGSRDFGQTQRECAWVRSTVICHTTNTTINLSRIDWCILRTKIPLWIEDRCTYRQPVYQSHQQSAHTFYYSTGSMVGPTPTSDGVAANCNDLTSNWEISKKMNRTGINRDPEIVKKSTCVLSVLENERFK